MEESGVGMDTYREMRSKYQLPLPIITYEEPNLFVSFPRTNESIRTLSTDKAIEQLNEEELVGFDFVKSNKEVSKKEYAAHFGFRLKKAQRHLTNMRDLGLITDNGESPNSPKYKYVSKD